MLNLTEEPLHQQLDILWEPAEDGARILRVCGEQPALRLPEYIEQRPVTEIGPYCFSRSEPKLPEQYFHFYTDESRTEHPVPQTENGRISAAESDPGAAHRRSARVFATALPNFSAAPRLRRGHCTLLRLL